MNESLLKNENMESLEKRENIEKEDDIDNACFSCFLLLLDFLTCK